jgi:hypothetical protein
MGSPSTCMWLEMRSVGVWCWPSRCDYSCRYRPVRQRRKGRRGKERDENEDAEGGEKMGEG